MFHNRFCYNFQQIIISQKYFVVLPYKIKSFHVVFLYYI